MCARFFWQRWRATIIQWILWHTNILWHVALLVLYHDSRWWMEIAWWGKFQKILSPFCHDAPDVSSTLCSIWLWAGSYPSANIFWAGEMPFSHMAHAIQCMWMCVCVCGVYRPKFINTWRAKIPKKMHGKYFRQQNGINARPIHGWNLFIETCYSDGISHFGFLVARCSHEFTSISMMKASYIFFLCHVMF